MVKSRSAWWSVSQAWDRRSCPFDCSDSLSEPLESCIDETNPPTKSTTAVLINPDTEIFVAPRPRHKTRAAKREVETPTKQANADKKLSKDGNGGKKPMSSIKQVTDIAKESPKNRDVSGLISSRQSTEPTESEARVLRPLGPSLALRSIPNSTFVQWSDCFSDLETQVQASQQNTSDHAGSELRWNIWTSKRAVNSFLRTCGGTARDGRTLVEVLPVSTPTPVVTDEETDAPAVAATSLRKNRKAVLRTLAGLPDGHAFLWPVWGSDDDVDAGWKVEDWKNIR